MLPVRVLLQQEHWSRQHTKQWKLNFYKINIQQQKKKKEISTHNPTIQLQKPKAADSGNPGKQLAIPLVRANSIQPARQPAIQSVSQSLIHSAAPAAPAARTHNNAKTIVVIKHTHILTHHQHFRRSSTQTPSSQSLNESVRPSSHQDCIIK